MSYFWGALPMVTWAFPGLGRHQLDQQVTRTRWDEPASQVPTIESPCRPWGSTHTPNLPTNIIPTKIRWLTISGEFPMGMIIPPLEIKILLESNPLKSRILVRRLAVSWKPMPTLSLTSCVVSATALTASSHLASAMPWRVVADRAKRAIL